MACVGGVDCAPDTVTSEVLSGSRPPTVGRKFVQTGNVKQER